ncbi:hypothetical protein A9Q94_06490 [Rhodobacterales bacterium 56_14_T64]|nr:hypothetical protein A9Q94_06490 [Rhodobacterales bacterium 56_14_T64]
MSEQSSSLLTRQVNELKHKERKADFTAAARDWSACFAAFVTSAVIVEFEKMAFWKEQAIQEFHVDRIVPEWSLQQHIDLQQIMGVTGCFLLAYGAAVLSSCCLRYLVFDSFLPGLVRRISELMRRAGR